VRNAVHNVTVRPTSERVLSYRGREEPTTRRVPGPVIVLAVLVSPIGLLAVWAFLVQARLVDFHLGP
jgi:hypothetical protein